MPSAVLLSPVASPPLIHLEWHLSWRAPPQSVLFAFLLVISPISVSSACSRATSLGLHPSSNTSAFLVPSATLLTRVTRKRVCVSVLSLRLMLKGHDVSINHFDPSRLFASMQPAYRTVIGSHVDGLAIQVTSEVIEGPDHC